MAEKFANDIATTLSGSINASQTTLVVSSATGFPSVNFRIRIDNEYLLVTGIVGTTWTVTRGIEGSTGASHSNAAAVTHVLTAGGLAQAIQDSVDILLDYTAATDINNGTTVPTATWTDVGTNQSFTVTSASSVVEIAVRGLVFAGAGSVVSGSEIASRIVIDSAGTPIVRSLGGETIQNSTVFANVLAGGAPIKVTGLAVGTHTIKTQVICAQAMVLYCRAASLAGVETYAIQVTEMAG